MVFLKILIAVSVGLSGSWWYHRQLIEDRGDMIGTVASFGITALFIAGSVLACTTLIDRLYKTPPTAKEKNLNK